MIRSILLLLNLVLIVKTNAQGFLNPFDTSAKHADSLLVWYGNWQKDGRFKTENGAFITVNGKTGEVKQEFANGGAGSEFASVVKEVDNTENSEKDLEKRYQDAGNDMKTYQTVQEAIELYQKLKEQTKDLILSKTDWGKDDGLAGKTFSGQGEFEDFVFNDLCPKLKPIYDDVQKYVEQVKAKRKAHDYDLLPPPSADYFNCWGCDKAKRDLYDTAVAHYSNHFFDESEKRINAILLIEKQRLLLGFAGQIFGENPSASKFHFDPGTKAHPTSCYFLAGGGVDLREALWQILTYEKERAWELFRKYRNDVTVCEPLINVCLKIERQGQLLGSGPSNILPELAGILPNLIEKWSKLLLKEKDYSKIADIPFILAIMRQRNLLSGSNVEDSYFLPLITFNRFKITIDLNLQLGENYYQISDFHSEGYLNAVIKTEAEQNNSSIPCLRWVPAGHYNGNKNMFLPVKLINVKWTGPCYSYIGTHDFYTGIEMHVHFCNEDLPDTLFLYSQFMPDPVGNAWKTCKSNVMSWPIPGGTGAQLFEDVEKLDLSLAAQATSGDLQKKLGNVTEMQQQALQMAQKLKEMQKDGVSPQEMAAQLNKTMQQANKGREALTNSIPVDFVPLHLRFSNKDKEPVKESENTFDAKSLNPGESKMIQKGVLKVSIIHAPYKTFEEMQNN